jgi:hypothetical protein
VHGTRQPGFNETIAAQGSARVCPKCFRSLAGLPPIGKCPACDEAYWPATVNAPGFRPFVSNREPWLRGTRNFSLVALALCLFVGCMTPWITLGVVVTCLGIAGVSGLILLRHRRTAKSTLRELDYRVCPGCRYILTGLADAAACPECGSPYTRDALKTIWRRQYRIREAARMSPPWWKYRQTDGQLTWQKPCVSSAERCLWIAIPLSGVALILFLNLRQGSAYLGGWIGSAAGMVFVAGQVAMVVALLRTQRRSRQLIVAARFRMCPGCRFDLKG